MIPAAILIAALLPGASATVTRMLPRIPFDEPGPVTAPATAPVRAAPHASTSATSAIANVRVNDPSQLAGPAGDITPAIAVDGDRVLIVWRVVGTLPTQRLRAAYSEDGGVMFTDAGWLPALPGNWRWGPDPCVEVDPFDGTFMVLAQVADPSIPATGVAVITAHISGGIQWGPAGQFPFVVGAVGSYFGESLEAVFDATNFTLHAAFTDNYDTPGTLTHRYSADHGATWFSPDLLVSDSTHTRGIAPRVGFIGGVGPLVTHVGGDYWQPQTVTASRFSWPSFQPGVTVDAHLTDEGSLPGSQVDGVSDPSLAVDRTFGRFSGTAYLAWVQSATLSPWPTPAGGVLTETEPDDTPAAAITIGAGQGHVSGSMTSDTDMDVFAVSLQAQQHLVVVPEAMQSLGAYPNLRFEFLAPDGTHGLGYTVVPDSDLGSARLLFTAPRTATYYLRVSNYKVGTYQFSVATSTLGAYPASDRRDLVVSRSLDGGATWSSPAPVHTSLPGFDAALVHVTVGNDGRPYLFWLDFSEASPDGAIATLRVTRSNDAGLTWETPRTVSSAPSDWQAVTVTSGGQKMGYRLDAATTPVNIGGFAARARMATTARLTAADPSEVMHVTWADARDGEGNIYAAHFPTGFEVLSVCNDTTAAPGQWVGLRMVLQNRNTLFPTAINTEFLACQRAWPSIHGSFSVDPGATTVVYPVVVQVPDTAAAGTVFYQASIDLGPSSYGINTFIHVVPATGVKDASAALAFAPPGPNPAYRSSALRFTLPAESEASLAIYDVRGARVRTIVSGRLAAGAHARTWDLADDAGHAVAPGLYLARLSVGDTRLVRRIAVVR